MKDSNQRDSKRISAFEVIGNKSHEVSTSQDQEQRKGDVQITSERINYPLLGSPIYPIEFNSEKYNGTILIGISITPSVPILSNDVLEGQTSNWNVATLGNFSCAILP
mmetsp:Transcript_37519/g.48549  ORF Transcript_37519/g.48549 Transcript_37519/m.48549 type:complete len:108 (-) Transcript_37519:427-750(-)